MESKKNPNKDDFSFSQPAVYQIEVWGELAKHWSDQLRGMQIIVDRETRAKPVSILTGQVRDQTALSGILIALYEFHLTILSVKMLEDK